METIILPLQPFGDGLLLFSLEVVWLFGTPWTAAYPSLSPTLLKFMSLESGMVSNHLILCHLFSSCLQSFSASGFFSNGGFFQLFAPGGQKYWSFSTSPSNESSRRISFRIDWLDFLAVQCTLKSPGWGRHVNSRPIHYKLKKKKKSLLQHHSWGMGSED